MSGKNPQGKSHAKRVRLDETESNDPSEMFAGYHFYFMPTGIGSSRMKIFQTQAIAHAASIDKEIKKCTTHVIVEDSLSIDKVCRILKWSEVPSNIRVVKTIWFSNCLKANKLINSKDFELINTCGKINKTKEDYFESAITKPDSEHASSQDVMKKDCTSDGSGLNTSSFVCSMSSSVSPKNHNKHITDKLEVLADMYRTTKDQWHAVGYEKAIIALKNHPKPVTTWEEAKSIKGIGDRLADKIVEIIQSGHLRKIDETCFNKRIESLKLFTKVWGVGTSTAETFVQQGLYTLEDLRLKGKLTKNQLIGLKYFDEFQERMRRQEASEIIKIVEDQVKMLYPKFNVIACGSYRRNRETCGDVDILISPSAGESHFDVLPKVVQKLHSIEFLTDDLISQEENGSQKKYMGVCKLPGQNKKVCFNIVELI